MRSASAAVRDNGGISIKSALRAISLDADLLDPRDVYRTGVIFIDCINRLQLNAIDVYEENLMWATEGRRGTLMWQLRGAPNYMRNMQSMEMGVAQNEYGFTYVDNLFARFTANQMKATDDVIKQMIREQAARKASP